MKNRYLVRALLCGWWIFGAYETRRLLLSHRLGHDDVVDCLERAGDVVRRQLRRRPTRQRPRRPVPPLHRPRRHDGRRHRRHGVARRRGRRRRLHGGLFARPLLVVSDFLVLACIVVRRRSWLDPARYRRLLDRRARILTLPQQPVSVK